MWRNCFTTSFKQLENRREGSKTIRRHEKVPQTPCDRLIAYYLEAGDKRSAKALDAWRSVHDPFELKGWIEQKLRQIWKLDSALNEAEIAGEIDLEGVAAPILRRSLRSDSASKLETRLDFLHQNKHR